MLRKQKEDSGLEDPSCCSKGLFQDRRGTRGKTLCDRILSASAHPLFSDLLPPFTTRTHETKLAQPNCFLSNRLASTPVPENFSSPSHRWRTEPNRNKRYENSRYRCKLNFTLLGKRLSILSLSLSNLPPVLPSSRITAKSGSTFCLRPWRLMALNCRVEIAQLGK